MSLTSQAQFFVLDPMTPASQLPADDHNAHLPVLEVSESEMPHARSDLIEIVVDELPGAPPGTKDPEPMLEVSEEPLVVSEEKTDTNDAKRSKNEKWDPSKHGPHGFVAWIKERIAGVPKHSGYDTAGLERAVAYFEKLDNEISKCMRQDLDGEIDANQVEKVRAQIDDAISRLQSRVDKVKQSKKPAKKSKRAEYIIDEEGFVKEAQKITGVSGVVITVPLLISRIARIIINGTVSAGHDTNDLFNRLAKKYDLTMREKAEVIQLLDDMGLYVRADRGYLPDEDFDLSSSDNFDWNANYHS